MSSSASPSRKIASNYLFAGGKLVADPLIEVDGDGCVVAVGRCAEPDRMAGVEFYAGILLTGLVDACCGVLTDASALRHRNAGTVAAGYTECRGDIPVVPGLVLKPVGDQVCFLSRILAGEPLPEGKTILIDTLLPQDRTAVLSGAADWCLCPRAVGREALLETIGVLKRCGITPVLGSYAPELTESRPLGECLPLLTGEPVAEVLAWATGCEVVPGELCALNVLTGGDYRAMCLTERSRLHRII